MSKTTENVLLTVSVTDVKTGLRKQCARATKVRKTKTNHRKINTFKFRM